MEENMFKPPDIKIVDRRGPFFPRNLRRIKSKICDGKEPHEPELNQKYKPKLHLKNIDLNDIAKFRDYIEKNLEIINDSNQNGENLLHCVACHEPKEKTIELFDYLIKNKCEPKKSNCGYTVIHLAAYYNNDLLIEHILDKFPNLNDWKSNDKNCHTPLHLAAKAGAKEAALCLIKRDADKEAKDYLGRTPLYIAAEYQESEVVKLLIEQGCQIDTKNDNGQKALYWIVAKCPQLVQDVLDKYRNLNKYAFEDIYYLKKVDIEPKDREQFPYVKSIIELIVEQENLEIISHPVIKTLINYKFCIYIWWFWIKFLVDVLICIIWNVWAVLIRYDLRYVYNFPQEWWRVFLVIFGLITMITVEIIELVSKLKYDKKIKETRNKEIETDQKNNFLQDGIHQAFFRNEEQLFKNKGFNISHYDLILYFTDRWNFFDLITIIFLIAALSTHLADILNHGETIARNHIRITSLTILFISARVLKSARILWEPLGMLVMILYFIVWDIFVWVLLFVLTWIPFTSSFYILFGNGQTVSCDPQAQVCLANNQTLLGGMETYPKAMFFLFTTSLGLGDIDFEKFNELDSEFSDFFFGLYVFFSSIILLNIFIALLTSTFERVRSYSKGFFLLERAKEILIFEKSLCAKTRIKALLKIPDKYIENYKPKEVNKDIGLNVPIEPIADSVRKLTIKWETMSNASEQCLRMQKDIEELKKSIDMLIQMNTKQSKHEVDVIYLNNKKSSVYE